MFSGCYRLPSQFANARPDCVNGVVYMGSAGEGLKANLELPVLSICGSRDPFTLGVVSRTGSVQKNCFQVQITVHRLRCVKHAAAEVGTPRSRLVLNPPAGCRALILCCSIAFFHLCEH